jgi:hypothetical protein
LVPLQYARITSSRLTIAFFLITFLHFALQLSFQSWAFAINARATDFLSEILTVGGLPPHDNFAVLVPLSKGGSSGGEMRLCNMTAMEAHDDIYECPVVWKGRSNSASAGAATGADYAAEPPATTSSSSSTEATSSTSDVGVIGTGEVTRSSTTRRTTATPSTPATLSTPVPPVAAPSPTSDDKESDDDSDDDSEEFDDRRLAKRNTPIIAVDPVNTGSTLPSNGANGQLTVFATNEVELPASMNTTSGELGVVLSKQCVQMLVWPNQMYVFPIFY